MTYAFVILLALQEPAPVPTSAPCRVFVTETKVNPLWYEKVRDIKYSKKWYGGSDGAFRALAQQGWQEGADAVVDAEVKHRPSAFSWASPRANGIAVKWTDEGRKGFSTLQGQCYDREEKK